MASTRMAAPASPSAGSSGPSQSLSLIDQALTASFWRLSLPGELEDQFRRDTFAARIAHTLRSGWLALFVFNSFLVVDWLMANDVFWQSVFIRLGVFTPVGVFVLLAAPHVARSANPRLTIPGTEYVVLFSGWGAALSLAVILDATRSPWAVYYHAGFMVVVIYGNLVQQLRFRFAVVFSSGILMLHVLGMSRATEFPAPLRLAMVQLLLGTVLCTLVANYLEEKARRRSYLLMLRERRLVDDLGKINQQLHKLSQCDVLTGLANRRHLHDHLAEVWTRCRIDCSPVSILMLDVDHFKAYNDRYGHPAGDECLRQVAQALEGCLRRPGDLVARYGGEEFVAVMQDTSGEAALQAATRVREAIEALQLPHEVSPTARVITASIGVATAEFRGKADTSDRLLSNADRALYEAKRGGRNRVVAYADASDVSGGSS